MAVSTIFTRFLEALGVPHTAFWSDSQFNGMTFKSLYGLSHLLQEYGVKNEGLRLTDKSEVLKLDAPFLAQLESGAFIIVTGLSPEKVSYESRGEHLETSYADFIKAWNGIVLLAYPQPGSAEPDYLSHRLTEIISHAESYVLGGATIVVFAWLFITRGLYGHISTILLALFNCVGLYFSYLLVQKSLNIHTAASDRVCGVLEQGGCDSILELKVSKLFGVFAWSEVGLGYFGISLLLLLAFPEMWPALALCNLCCLPYTLWSISYQKFVAKHWCTLCVGVQTCLWLLFFCYLGGGWLAQAFPPNGDFLVAICCYILAVVGLNLSLNALKKLPCNEKDQTR